MFARDSSHYPRLPSLVIRISVVQFSMTKPPLSYSRLLYYSRLIPACQAFFSRISKVFFDLRFFQCSQFRANLDSLWQYTTLHDRMSSLISQKFLIFCLVAFLTPLPFKIQRARPHDPDNTRRMAEETISFQ